MSGPPIRQRWRVCADSQSASWRSLALTRAQSARIAPCAADDAACAAWDQARLPQIRSSCQPRAPPGAATLCRPGPAAAPLAPGRGPAPPPAHRLAGAPAALLRESIPVRSLQEAATRKRVIRPQTDAPPSRSRARTRVASAAMCAPRRLPRLRPQKPPRAAPPAPAQWPRPARSGPIRLRMRG